MVRHLTISQDKFEKLLAWLDDDRDAAGAKYEGIRQSLIKIFTWRGCHESEDLADEVINRVTSKIDQVVVDYTGDPALYFYGVAKKLHLEHLRWEQRRGPMPENLVQEPPPPDNVQYEADRLDECLKQCARNLSPDERELIIAYYRENKQAKIDNRKLIAKNAGLTLNNLRVKAYRLRVVLEKCIRRCLAEGPSGEMD